jgi:hypothetical protein
VAAARRRRRVRLLGKFHHQRTKSLSCFAKSDLRSKQLLVPKTKTAPPI